MADSPDFIGKYPISGLIARGGMGAVYKAVHPTLNRPIILKKLTVRGNPQFIERFKREAKIMMDFKHDNIVTVYDHFKEGNSYYIALEYVDGFSLDELVKRERALPSVLAMHVFLQICRALKYAHDSGVIHRDIKPANVLISKAGQVKLVDFGIAAYEEEEEGESLTTNGMTLGTPSYMPPEQFEDTKSVDKCADIYAMGVVLYEMVTGKKPFPGNFAPDTINMIQKGRYLRVLKLNPKVDRTVARLTGKMIKPRKRDRFQDLAPVIKILERRLKREDPAQADEHLKARMNGKPFEYKAKRRHVLKRALAAAIVCLAVAAGPAFWLVDSGYYHEWLDPDAWGRFEISVLRPATVDDALPVTALLYAEKSGQLSRLAGLPLPGTWRSLFARAAALVPALKAAPGLRSDAFYAKSGSYRIKLQSGNKLLWDTFFLEPLSLQRLAGRKSGLALSYELGEPLPKAVTFQFDVADERLGQAPASGYRVLMETRSGEWSAIEDFPKEQLLSGRSYRIRVLAEGYQRKEFSIKVEPGQTEVAIQATLAPLTASLRIKTDQAALGFAINGRGSILSGDESREIVELSVGRGKPLALKLPPGNYSIQVGSGKRAVKKDIRLSSGDALALEFYKDAAAKSMGIR